MVCIALDAAGAAKPEKKEKKEEEDLPVVLDRQRVTILQIIIKRFAAPVSMIKRAIIDCDLTFLTVDTLSELISLFPSKTFDMEVIFLLVESN